MIIRSKCGFSRYLSIITLLSLLSKMKKEKFAFVFTKRLVSAAAIFSFALGVKDSVQTCD